MGTALARRWIDENRAPWRPACSAANDNHPAGATTSYASDTSGTYATSRFGYDGHGLLLTASDPLGVVTANVYDSFGNLLTRVRDFGGSGHLNVTDLFSYDGPGDAISHTDPNRNATTFGYDADRRLNSSVDPTGLTTTTVYDADGHPVSVTRANRGLSVGTSATYTNTGQVWTATDANANTTSYGYDGDDHLISITDPLNRVTAYGYDAMGRRLTVGNPAIQAAPLSTLAYTPDGLVRSLTDANAHTTTFTPDGFDRRWITAYPSGGPEVVASFKYSAGKAQFPHRYG